MAPIRIETGQYIGERPEARLCRFCSDQEIENESHFLLDCTFYCEIRTLIFGDLLTSNSFVNMKNGSSRKGVIPDDIYIVISKFTF